jgi:hypothetical protein
LLYRWSCGISGGQGYGYWMETENEVLNVYKSKACFYSLIRLIELLQVLISLDR